MVMLTPKQREAVYPLANLMVFCFKLTEYPLFFNLPIGNFKYNAKLNEIFQVPKVVEFLESKLNHFTKCEYARKLGDGFASSKSNGFGFTVSVNAFFPDSEGKEVYDNRLTLRDYARWNDHLYLKDQHSLLKEDFAKGVDVYLGDEVVGKVYELYTRLDKTMAKISHRKDYLQLKHPRFIDDFVLIPHLEYKVVKEFQDQNGMTVKHIRPTIHKFTMYDRSEC